MIVLYDASLLGLLALAFAIGFGAGWWTAIGSVALVIRFILFGMSDRRPIPHHEVVDSNDRSSWYGLDNFIPVMSWPSMWRWPMWRKGEIPGTDQESQPEREV